MTDFVYKYELNVDDVQTLELPLHSEILCVQVQHDRPRLWAIVNPELPTEGRVIETVGTGHPLKELDVSPHVTGVSLKREYIGTYQLQAGGLIFHVFEIAVKRKKLP